MASQIWESCLLVPGFSRTECAAWVQAWGSILALFIAILVPLAMHVRERRLQQEVDFALAGVAATSLALQLNLLIGALKTAASETTRYQEGQSPQLNVLFIQQVLKKLMPPDDNLVAKVCMVQPVAARSLTAGNQSFLQYRNAIDLLCETDPYASSQPAAQLENVLVFALQAYEMAKEQVDNLVSEVQASATFKDRNSKNTRK